MPAFHHQDLALLNPAFDSALVDVGLELEYLRRLRLGGSTPPSVFFQLKRIFHMLESLGSARIEGNHTTLADYVESRLEVQSAPPSDHLREMANIETAMGYIEEQFQPGQDITEHFVRELHQLTVEGLVREGDVTPGAYRMHSVSISRSDHLPPESRAQVDQYMSELVAFVNRADPPKYRLLTYALLIKYGFNVKAGGRVLNPTAVFCNDRDRYYAMLGRADTGTLDGKEAWCVYVLEGMRDELKKVDRLADQEYLQERILIPALRHARERALVTPTEERVLLKTAQLGRVMKKDLEVAMPEMNDTQRTYQIRKLVERKMLMPIAEGARQYTLGFSNSYLIRGVIRSLSAEGFIPESLNRPQ
jgi:Fic family protein